MRPFVFLYMLAGLAVAVGAKASEPTMSVPVLANSLVSGDVIGERDLTWVDMPRRQVTQTMVVNSRDLVGMAVRRPLMSNNPVRFADIQRPILVKRGSLVTMVVKTQNMTLTAVGRAQENGAKGDHIRLSNVSSNTSISGIVTSEREVMIVSSSRIAGLAQ